MMDLRKKTFRGFAADEKGEIAWFDCSTVDTVSVQAVAVPGWSGAPVFEAVISNDGGTPYLLSTLLGATASTYEIGTSGVIVGAIDAGGIGFGWLGMRVKTAGSSGDRADIIFCGKSQGSGQIVVEFVEHVRGM